MTKHERKQLNKAIRTLLLDRYEDTHEFEKGMDILTDLVKTSQKTAPKEKKGTLMDRYFDGENLIA